MEQDRDDGELLEELQDLGHKLNHQLTYGKVKNLESYRYWWLEHYLIPKLREVLFDEKFD
jgi:hypothetical protein